MRPDANARRRPRIVFGVIGNDIHVVANRVLAIALAENGFDAYNLGTNNTLDDFVDAAMEVQADAALIGSINGEGESWCVDAGARFAAAGLGDVLLYCGGNLVVGDRPPDEVALLFASFGFDRVFHRSVAFDVVLDALVQDLHLG